MTSMCDLPIEDLVAYLDGELRGGRQELVEAHLQACPDCRRRRARFEEVDRLLRESSPLTDDPAGRAAIAARVARQSGASGRARLPLRRAVAVLALLVALSLALGWPALSQARPGLGRFVRFTDQPLAQGVPVGQEPPGTPLAGVQLPQPGIAQGSFRPLEPERLPLGLELVARATGPTGRRELHYRNADGVAVLVTQEPARGAVQTIAGDYAETVVVGDSEVLWLKAPQPEAVARLSWERGGVFYQLWILRPPAGGLSFAEARLIVEALIASQETAR